MSRAVQHVREWYERRSDEFKAAWVSAWITFLTTITVPILGLIDDVQDWVEGTGALGWEDLISVGRVIVAGLFGLVAWAINYLFRRWRPNVTYSPPESD